MAPTAMTAMGTPVAVASSDPWSQALLSSLAPAAGPLEAVQRRGRAGLTHQAMPSRRAEAWRFTDTAVIQAIAPQLLQPAPEALPACGEGVWRLRLDGGEEALADQAWPAGLTPLLGPDLELALGLGARTGIDVPVARLVEQLHRRALDAYGPRSGEMSVLKLYEDAAGAPFRASPPPDRLG